ncbi:transposase DNA-binding-containing protein [Trichocoleus desertorum]
MLRRCCEEWGMNWVAEELWDVDLGDARRNRRLVKIVEDLVAQPGSPKKDAL